MSDEYSISLLCETLGVAKGSYFNQTLRNKKGIILAAQKRAVITPVIEQIFQDNNQIVGAEKIQTPLTIFNSILATNTSFVNALVKYSKNL